MILFSEKQHFKQWWLWLILLSLNILFIYGVYKQVICGEQFGDNPGSNGMLISTCIFSIIISLFIAIIRLDTEVKQDGIYFRFFPVQFKYRQLKWEELSKTYVRKYNAIAEYGGWGLRIGLFGKGRAYNISGNKGLQIETNDGKKILIGTKKPEELTSALTSIEKYKP